MGPERQQSVVDPVRITNRAGRSPIVIACEHASNFLPPQFATLGLQKSDLTRHIAWDPGAVQVAEHIAAALDATLIQSRVSRLVVDCNRRLDAPDLITAVSEMTVIPGNAGLSAEQREQRIALAWKPFHDAVEDVLSERLARGQQPWLVSVHSFSPVYNGRGRPWQVCIVHDEDRRLATPLIAALSTLKGVVVGVNEPYSPADRVYFTLEVHARSRGLPCAMIEMRNDELSDEAGQRKWGELLAGILSGLEATGVSGPGGRELGQPA